MSLLYYIKNGGFVRGGYTYGELTQMSLYSNFMIMRGERGKWMPMSQCVELHPYIIDRPAEVDDIENDCVVVGGGHAEGISSGHLSHRIPMDDYPDAVFVPGAEYFKCKHKRKAAMIGVLTLGIAFITQVGVVDTWRSNIFAGTSMSKNDGIGLVLKCVSFMFLLVLVAVPYFIYSVFALIYYSVRMHNLKNK